VKVHHATKIISAFKHTKPIGAFRMDVSTVFNEKEHAFERKWANLMNPDNIEVNCGHLLVSIAVTERGVPTKVKRFLLDNINLFVFFLFQRMFSVKSHKKKKNMTQSNFNFF
jgi:hypothetical protein